MTLPGAGQPYLKPEPTERSGLHQDKTSHVQVTDYGSWLNSPQSLTPLVQDGRISMRRIWGMLALRSVLSFGLLLAVAVTFMLSGRTLSLAVSASAAWWLWFVTITNVVSIMLMVRFCQYEGLRLKDMYFASQSTWKGDLKWLLLALVVTAVIAQPPGNLLASLLWGNVNHPNGMLFQELPVLAIYPLFILMPTTHALAELPIYWGYVAPRLRATGMKRWVTIFAVGAVLSVQHLFFSFQLDWRYDLWLAVKFLPFALWTGYVVDRRPSTLPYLMGAHLALDSTLPLFVLLVTNGTSLG